jgi:hypothetical protein
MTAGNLDVRFQERAGIRFRLEWAGTGIACTTSHSEGLELICMYVYG